MEKTDLFAGISPRGAAGVIVRTLNELSSGQVPTQGEQELLNALKRHMLPHIGTRNARVFEAIRTRIAHIASGNNGGHFAKIFEELIQCGFTRPRLKSIPFDLIALRFPEASKILAREFPISSSGGLILILAKDKSGHWRLFA